MTATLSLEARVAEREELRNALCRARAVLQYTVDECSCPVVWAEAVRGLADTAEIAGEGER